MNSVRTARPDDVPRIVAIHRQAFPGFFLTSLGDRFLSRFYQAMTRAPDAICLVAERGAGIDGFIVGPLHPAGYFRRLFLSRGLAFAFDAIPALIKRPGAVGARLLRAVRYRGEAPVMWPDAALVSSVAVAPDAVGSGAAGALIEGFCAQAAARGAGHVYLTTDIVDNPAANRFYRKHSFEVESVLVRPDGRMMNRYLRRLGDAEAADGRARGGCNE
jgi:ribosomal protein S18 acetylase RimI-like enzyme